MPSPPSPPSAAPVPAPPPAGASPHEPRGPASDPQSLPVDAPQDRDAPLPHERDESADRAAPGGTEPSQRTVGEQARRDLESGRQDTDRGPVTERVYERVKRRER